MSMKMIEKPIDYFEAQIKIRERVTQFIERVPLKLKEKVSQD